MSVSLPPDKLADIQQLPLYLWQTQPVTVCRVMSFLGKANCCANSHSKLQRLCCVIQSDMLTVYHSPTHLFSPVHFSISALCQLRLLILVAPCWMEASWLPTVLNILADIPGHCPIIKDLIMDVSVGYVLKGLPYLHLTHWLLRDVCCGDRVLFLSLSGSDMGNSSIYIEGLAAVLEGMGRLVCARGCTNNAISAPKLAYFWFIY